MKKLFIILCLVCIAICMIPGCSLDSSLNDVPIFEEELFGLTTDAEDALAENDMDTYQSKQYRLYEIQQDATYTEIERNAARWHWLWLYACGDLMYIKTKDPDYIDSIKEDYNAIRPLGAYMMLDPVNEGSYMGRLKDFAYGVHQKYLELGGPER